MKAASTARRQAAPELTGQTTSGEISGSGAARLGSGQTIASELVRRLQDLLRSPEMAPGRPLPPQRELARRLGVSRASLREALSILATMGLVRTEPYRGTFAVAEDEVGAPVAAQGPWRYADRYSPAEVYQFRYVVEASAAAIAALEASEVEVAALKRNLERFREATRDADLVASSQCDYDFHQLIMLLSRNRLMLDFHRRFHDVLLESQRLPLAHPKRRFEPVVEHSRIVEAIAMHDADGAAYHMRAHILRAADRVGVTIAAPA